MDAHVQKPLAERCCPLCGAANECAVAASGDFNTPCWCRGVSFPAELLAAVPEEMRGRACICRSCAEAAAGETANEQVLDKLEAVPGGGGDE